MSFNEWKSENMTGFETWKAENKQVKTGGGGLAEFGKGVVDAYLLGAKGAIGTVATATTRTREEPTMIPSLGYQKIGLEPGGTIPTALREAQAKIESARGRFEMTHAGVSAKAGRILGNAIGYMSQAMAGGYTAGPIGAAMVGFNIEGQSAYDDAIKSGATETQAQNERLIVGSINAGIEALQITRLMKFQQAGKHSIKNFIRLAKQRAYKRMAATGKQFGADILRHSIEEGLEEFVQEGVSVSVPALFRGEYPKKEDGTVDLWALGERLGAAFVGGAFAGGVLGAAGQVQIGVRPEGQILYHGSPKKGLTEIQPSRGDYGYGVYLAEKDIAQKDYAPGRKAIAKYVLGDTDILPSKGYVYPVRPNLSNPLVIENEEQYIGLLDEHDDSNKGIGKYAREAGYDGIINKYTGEHIVFTDKPLSTVIEQPKPSESIPEAMDINELLGYGHAIPEALGMQDEERRAYMESLIGKRSMSDMNPQELEDLMWQLRKDADAAGIDLNKLVQQFQPSVELNKQMQSLKRYKKPLGEFEERRKGKILKAADWTKGKVESYLLRQDRMKNITRMLDGYKEDGPMSRLIFDPVKTASVKAKDAANQLMYNLRLSANEQGIDISKMFDRKPLSVGVQKKIEKGKVENVYGKDVFYRGGEPTGALEETGALFFTDSESVAQQYADKEFPVTSAKLTMNKPLDLRPSTIGRDAAFEKISQILDKRIESIIHLTGEDRNTLIKYAKDNRYDGLMMPDTDVSGKNVIESYVIFDKTQIQPPTGTKPEAALIKTKKGKDILLSDSEAVGIYYLAQNPKARKNIEAIFKEDGVDPKTAIQTINDYVEKNEDLMYVYRDARAYFDQMGPRFFDVVKELEIKGVVPEQNYITMLLNKGDEEGTADIMAEMADQFGFPTPGKKHTKERTGAIRSMNMDIFSITAQASRSLERFINVAPVIKRVNKLMEKKSFKDNLNAVTKGKGVRIFKKWLADSARGSSNVNMNSIDKTATWLRRNAVLYTLGAKIFTVVPKQAISLSNAVAKRPAMLPVVLKTIDRMADPRVSKQLEERAVNKSKLVKNRDWERDLRKVWTTANIKKFFKGKKLSPIAMRSITWMDRKTVTVVWNSAYDLALADGLEDKQARKYADDMVQTTQPMAGTEDLPDYFRGGAIPKALTTFMNQRNQNWQFLRHDILGEYGAGKVGKGMAMYRFLFSQILPSMMLGMITRGRLPKDAKEMALDLGSYIVTPQIFLGRFVWNMLTGEWRSDTSAAISALPLRGFEEVSRGADALQRGDYRKAVERGIGAVGAFTGKIPQQAITTGGGVVDLMIGETDDLKRLIYSEYMIEKYGEETPEGMWE